VSFPFKLSYYVLFFIFINKVSKIGTITIARKIKISNIVKFGHCEYDIMIAKNNTVDIITEKNLIFILTIKKIEKRNIITAKQQGTFNRS